MISLRSHNSAHIKNKKSLPKNPSSVNQDNLKVLFLSKIGRGIDPQK
jgi:hypothetical protein